MGAGMSFLRLDDAKTLAFCVDAKYRWVHLPMTRGAPTYCASPCGSSQAPPLISRIGASAWRVPILLRSVYVYISATSLAAQLMRAPSIIVLRMSKPS